MNRLHQIGKDKPLAYEGAVRSMDKRLEEQMKERNRRIIDAVIRRAEREYPGTLAMIGIYGSFCTGDFTTRSDLDLIILINDDRGWALSKGFLLGGIGFDLYCTTWEMLETEAAYTSPHIAKLMDSKIVYCPREEDHMRLQTLREGVDKLLRAPYCAADFERADRELAQAERVWTQLLYTDETPAACRSSICMMLYHLENAVCLLNKTYFRLGVKRIFEEFGRMRYVPENFEMLIRRLTAESEPDALRIAAGALMRSVKRCFASVRKALPAAQKAAPTAQALSGTLEEMVSNWRGKVLAAAEQADAHAALMALGSLQSFFDDLAEEFDMPRYDALACFDPKDLRQTAANFDAVLEHYREQYDKTGLSLCSFEMLEAFESAYNGP